MPRTLVEGDIIEASILVPYFPQSIWEIVFVCVWVNKKKLLRHLIYDIFSRNLKRSI